MICKKLKSNRWLSLSALALTSLFVFTSPIALSDDIEVYLQEPPDPVPPNILFVLDESGSMQWGERNWSYPGSPYRRRDLLVNALKDVFNDDSMANVNAALLGYSTRGTFAHSGAFKVISEGTNQSSFISQIDSLTADGGTPTVEALNDAVDWFRSDATFTDSNNNTYLSPLEEAGVRAEDMRCAPNHIVLLSDGEPNNNIFTEYNGTQCSTDNIFPGTRGDPIPGDRCANEIAAYANSVDLMEDSAWYGNQNITLSTMGFYTSGNTRTFLEELAEAGGGTYYDSSGGTLVQDLTDIITSAQTNIDYAYTAPVIPFSAENSAISGEEIYVPMFVPEDSIFWRGNLKKYTITISENDVLLTAMGNDTVLNESQEFESTRDLFCEDDSCALDEGNPLVGGVAQDMTEVRNLYTYLGSNSALTHTSNRVRDANTAITTAMLGVATEEARTELLNWITRDSAYVATEDNPSHSGVMGAPIHTQPIVVDYGTNDVVLIPTSEGVLMAIDADLGEELWSFMPQDLLPGIRTIKNNEASSIPYYGLDGPMTYYEIGNNKMVIFGMRRGGRKYHILNITDRLAPEYIAEISSTSSDFSKLGQTWSKPLFVKMLIDGTEQEVLVFGGGYDPDQDDATPPAASYTDSEGNAIYIVQASDGSLVKSISNTGADVNISDMIFAIPSDIATVDLNGNAIVERLYASDVGGRIIRIDIDEDDETNTISGGVIADINDSADAHRKLFTTPQLGYYNKAGTQFLAILIGTGDIANPVDNNLIIDRFYMIKDPAIWYTPDWDTYEAADDDDFLDASDTTVSGLDATKRGWYIDYTSDTEKSFSKAILYDYSIFFTTYSAETIVPDSLCEAVGTIGTA
ncbi:MAG: VWA domain-containing protein, partial [Candidatus Thiodiazotropha sp.]